MTLFPRTLAWRLIVLLILAFVAAQAATVVIFQDERRGIVRTLFRESGLERTATLARLLQETPPDLHERVVAAASSRRLQFWLTPESTVEDRPRHRDNPVSRHLAGLLADGDGLVLVDIVRDADAVPPPPPPGAWQHRERHHAVEAHPMHEDAGRTGGPPELRIAVRLGGDVWLNATTRVPPQPDWTWPLLASIGLTVAAMILVVTLTVRAGTRPLARLADAADRMGRGEREPPLPETGPEEVRRTTAAFNRMRERIGRFVADRTRMLAAISHDLRTPITALRLRAEMVDDEEIRRRMLETLADMERMTEATLAFAREDAAVEDTRTVDLDALVGSVVDDLAEIGLDAAYAEGERLPYPCRPVGLRRAVRNLVENAVAYGMRARVAIAGRDGPGDIVVEEDGPGIAPQDRERVFEPFVRLEGSRSRDTGGVGLGLAIARSIARAHGGDVLLENRPEGGLRAILRLPATTP